MKKFSLKKFIAEIGVNHENSIDNAKLMIDQCSKAGVGAVKFQSYHASKIAAKNSPAYWDLSKEKTPSQHELFSKYDHWGESEFIELADYCKSKSIEFMSTPFDDEYVEILNPLVKRYKIASVDLTNYFLIEKIVRMNKPIILSSGASSVNEIKSTVNFLKDLNFDVNNQLTILHCVIKYPNYMKDSGLGNIPVLIKEFPEIKIGYSDHTVPDDSMKVLPLALGLGAEIIEKHFTFDKSIPGNDHYHAFDKNDLNKFKVVLDEYNDAIKTADLELQNSSRLYARRGLYLNQSVKKGSKISKEMLTPLRPQMNFITPSDWYKIKDKIIKIDRNEGDGLSLQDFE